MPDIRWIFHIYYLIEFFYNRAQRGVIILILQKRYLKPGSLNDQIRKAIQFSLPLKATYFPLTRARPLVAKSSLLSQLCRLQPLPPHYTGRVQHLHRLFWYTLHGLKYLSPGSLQNTLNQSFDYNSEESGFGYLAAWAQRSISPLNHVWSRPKESYLTMSELHFLYL